MDAFAFDPPNGWPIGLAPSPNLSVAEVNQVVLFYPYCGFGSRTASSGWQHKPNVLALLAETDRVVGETACPKMLTHLSDSGQQVTTHIYPGVDHAFDVEVVTTSSDWPRVSDPVAAKAGLEDALRRVVRFINSST
jgi:dienelactone hydrolase